jgi:hypothetical protein
LPPRVSGSRRTRSAATATPSGATCTRTHPALLGVCVALLRVCVYREPARRRWSRCCTVRFEAPLRGPCAATHRVAYRAAGAPAPPHESVCCTVESISRTRCRVLYSVAERRRCGSAVRSATHPVDAISLSCSAQEYDNLEDELNNLTPSPPAYGSAQAGRHGAPMCASPRCAGRASRPRPP